MKKTAARPAASKPVARKPIPATRPAAGSVPAPRPRSAPRKPAAPKPVAHISPEEAVAHIQALLDAKQERVRQGPTWPGAEQQAHPDTDAGLHAQVNPSTSPVDAGNSHILAHERGEQSKRGKS